MKPTEDFLELLHPKDKDTRPFQYLWVFDPATNKAHIEPGSNNNVAEFPIHQDMAEDISHPDRQHGYAVRIKNGWRIFDEEMEEVDPFVKKCVHEALEGKHPHPGLPHILYHGDPRSKHAHR